MHETILMVNIQPMPTVIHHACSLDDRVGAHRDDDVLAEANDGA
jgi:hypothetical protein